MATITAINSRHSKSHGSLQGTLNYTMQDHKTVWEGEKLVGTLNCVAGSAYREFINTKQMFGKDNGQMYFHFVLSFPDSEKITPKQCHEYAMDFAKRKWDSFEVVACTHSDNDHIHTHFIINSVSFENGKRFHSDQKLIHDLHELNDRMCLQYGYRVTIRRPKEERVRAIRPSEYHSAMKGQSWKMELRIAIDEAMKYATSRKHFIEIMNGENYFVRWEKDRKSITYTCPNGMKCRGEKLNEKKYLKEVMEREFRIRKQIVDGGTEVPSAYERGEGEGHDDAGGSDGRQLGRAYQQHTAVDGGDGAEHVRAGISGDGGLGERAAGRSGGTSAEGTDGDAGEDRGSAGKNPGGAEESERFDPVADGEIDLRDIRTGWEGERQIFLSVLRNEGRYEKMAEKSHVDRAHTVGADVRIGAAALDLVGGLIGMFEGDGRPGGDPDDGDEDDIDKELRREIKAVKDGINLVM